MFTTAIYTRPALTNDRQRLNRLLGEATLVHNHLDWQPPQDWLGQHPFRFAYVGERVIGTLAAPPDPPGVVWVRIAAVVDGFPVESILDQLWIATQDSINALRIAQVNCMLLKSWLAPHLHRWGFTQFNDVVVLRREARQAGALKLEALTDIRIRPACRSDLDAMTQVDQAAFVAPWQYSQRVIQQAITQSTCVTVAERDRQIIGYQLSSGGWGGAHLARLAVLPELQGRGIGRALVANMIEYFNRRSAPTITVNTQRDNASSLAVYKTLGFGPTGEHYEVWQWRATRI